MLVLINYPNSQEQYIKDVKSIINKNHSALVFYDVGIQGATRGLPKQKKGKYEHAAAVFGYCTLNNTLHFVVGQWGKFYLQNASEIADSALQIEHRKAETFLKIKTLFFAPQWIEKKATRHQLAHHWLYKYFVNETMAALTKTALDIRDANASANSKILGKLIFDIHPHSNLINQNLITEYDNALKELKCHVSQNKKHSVHYKKLEYLITVFEEQSLNLSSEETRDNAISICLDNIKKVHEEKLFEHESNRFLRALRKITLAFAVILSFGVAAYLKQEYSYKTHPQRYQRTRMQAIQRHLITSTI